MIGQKIAQYEILEKLGEGGMGVVYKARDTKLDRNVALKFLPAHLAASESDKARFIQEAKAAATLNHPNICTVHDIGDAPDPDGKGALIFIVMEFVEGQMLQEKKSSLTLRQAVEIGIQVAEGLGAAHEKGIVHRDIKPENIMLRKDGIAQIMDFGLARMRASRSTRLTKEGSTVGTAGYMSPEQVQGQDVDHRSDIFSLGVLLYEMFTGRMPFQGVHETAIHYEVVNVDPPPPTAVKPDLDPELDRIILECLQKEADERYNSVKDVAKDLKRFKRESSRQRTSRVTAVNRSAIRPGASGVRVDDGAEGAGAGPSGARRYLWPALAGVFLVATVVLFALRLSGPPAEPAATTKFLVPFGGELSFPLNTSAVDISPDGRTIALILQENLQRGRMIYLRRLDALALTPVTGTEGAGDVRFSPDGDWLAFSTGGKVYKIPVTGGSAIPLASVAATRGIAWGEGDRLVFPTSPGSPLYLVSRDGGELRQITTIDTAAGEASHRLPDILPGGEALIYTVKKNSISRFSEAIIVAQRMDGTGRTTLVQGGTGARYLRSGHLLYAQGPSLLMVPFDASKLEITGSPRVVLDSAGMMNEAFGYFLGAASWNGNLVYTLGGPLPTQKNILQMYDISGRELPFVDDPGSIGPFSISPDGEKVAVQVFSANDDIWIIDVARRLSTRLTFAGGNNWYPLWTPDGRSIVYTAERNGKANLFLKPADGTGAEKKLTDFPGRQTATSFSADGRFVVFQQEPPDSTADIWMVQLSGDDPPELVVQSRFDEFKGEVSPDGRMIAYVSNESGGPEVFVRPFPSGNGKWQISTTGGDWPHWTKGGREIVYLSLNQDVMRVPVDAAGGFRPGAPSKMFRLPRSPIQMAVSPGGDRVTMSAYGGVTDIREAVVALNWFTELRMERGMK